MFEMDGLEVICVIRKLFKYNSLMIIVMMVNVMFEDWEKCINVGMDDYLVKFFKFCELQ